MKTLTQFIRESLINEAITVKAFTGDLNNFDSVVSTLEELYKVKLNKTMTKEFQNAYDELGELIKNHGEVVNIYSNRQDAAGFKDGMKHVLLGGKYMLCACFTDNTHFYWSADSKEWLEYEFEGKVLQ